jgi:predicted DNA binding CopG/RHH family protein
LISLSYSRMRRIPNRKGWFHDGVAGDRVQIVESIASQQQLSESAELRRLITSTLQTTGAAPKDAAEAEFLDEAPRAARLMIRLVREDQLLLQARAAARGMPSATYISVVVRAHLRGVVPLPKDELQALRRATAELAVIGRNLNQLARAANQSGRVTGPSREELRALLRACEGLRDHFRRLLDVNLRSWEVGRAEAPV